MAGKQTAQEGVGQQSDALNLARAMSLAMDQAWNARDASAMAALFEPDGDFTFHNGLHIRGRNRIERFWSERVFPMTPDSLRHLGTINGARFLTEDVAVGTVDFKIYDASLVDGAIETVRDIPEDAVHLHTRGVGIAVRHDEVWRYAVIQLWVPEGRSP
jgi:uncharacterized protein (TIGR02246 family)